MNSQTRIISNRLREMIKENNTKNKAKKQIELAELLSHVFGTYFGKQFEKQVLVRILYVNTPNLCWSNLALPKLFLWPKGASIPLFITFMIL